MLFRLYIGSNNKTHQVNEEKLKEIINKYFEGYTIINSIGYWKGTKEESRIIEIDTTNKEQVIKAIQELKEALEQEAIGLIEIKENIQFI
jgi:hypothetical protein